MPPLSALAAFGRHRQDDDSAFRTPPFADGKIEVGPAPEPPPLGERLRQPADFEDGGIGLRCEFGIRQHQALDESEQADDGEHRGQAPAGEGRIQIANQPGGAQDQLIQTLTPHTAAGVAGHVATGSVPS